MNQKYECLRCEAVFDESLIGVQDFRDGKRFITYCPQCGSKEIRQVCPFCSSKLVERLKPIKQGPTE